MPTISGFSMNFKLEGSYAVLHGLGKLQPEVKEKTLPEIRRIADDVRKSAKSKIQLEHPHNLWRESPGGGRLTPAYSITHPGTYWIRIQTPGTQAGKAEAMAEFMARSIHPQGGALIDRLNSVYGRSGGSGNGRILWAARDEMDEEITRRVEDAIAKATAEVQKEVDTVG